MRSVVTWDEWLVFAMACLFVGAVMAGSVTASLMPLLPCVIRGWNLARRPWLNRR